eukprot:TRINITY_DN1170_c0_g1_i2.p1 TRINITY_DN1170_c0_g1~~TRINITY_DN1170_c0_g1_i2.p1  ORF type:complete len:884 (+),score=182.93 TRINITY_DN1170_c0_g1_i2:52-2652(+)
MPPSYDAVCTLWATYGRGDKTTPVYIEGEVNEAKGSDVYILLEDGSRLEIQDKKVHWMYMATICMCCGIRERELFSNGEAGQEHYNKRYGGTLKSLEAGQDVRDMSRLEVMCQDGNALSIGLACKSKRQSAYFRALADAVREKLGLVSCKKTAAPGHLKEIKKAPAPGKDVKAKAEAARAQAEAAQAEADRHMQELLAEEEPSQKKRKSKKAKPKGSSTSSFPACVARAEHEGGEVLCNARAMCQDEEGQASIDELAASDEAKAVRNLEDDLCNATTAGQDEDGHASTDEPAASDKAIVFCNLEEDICNARAVGPDEEGQASIDELAASDEAKAVRNLEDDLCNATTAGQDEDGHASTDEPAASDKAIVFCNLEEDICNARAVGPDEEGQASIDELAASDEAKAFCDLEEDLCNARTAGQDEDGQASMDEKVASHESKTVCNLEDTLEAKDAPSKSENMDRECSSLVMSDSVPSESPLAKTPSSDERASLKAEVQQPSREKARNKLNSEASAACRSRSPSPPEFPWESFVVVQKGGRKQKPRNAALGHEKDTLTEKHGRKAGERLALTSKALRKRGCEDCTTSETSAGTVKSFGAVSSNLITYGSWSSRCCDDPGCRFGMSEDSLTEPAKPAKPSKPEKSQRRSIPSCPSLPPPPIPVTQPTDGGMGWKHDHDETDTHRAQQRELDQVKTDTHRAQQRELDEVKAALKLSLAKQDEQSKLIATLQAELKLAKETCLQPVLSMAETPAVISLDDLDSFKSDMCPELTSQEFHLESLGPHEPMKLQKLPVLGSLEYKSDSPSASTACCDDWADCLCDLLPGHLLEQLGETEYESDVLRRGTAYSWNGSTSSESFSTRTFSDYASFEFS